MKSFLRSILALPASRGAASEFRKTSVGGISPLAHYFLKHQPVRCAIITLLPLTLLAGAASANTVEVDPSNMNGWAFGSFDGNTFLPVNSGPYLGTAQMVNGPASPPLGSGSAHLATNPGFGDGAEAISTNAFNGTPLSAITSLSYWAYMANNGPVNLQQFPYLDVAISTDGNPIQPDGSNLDLINFEPPYQIGNPANNVPAQGATILDTWQLWNAAEGGWWDGTIGGYGGVDNVEPLSAFITAYPDAVIADPSPAFPGFDGINLQVGFADSGSTFDGNVDDFTFGTEAGLITYDFNAPEPASLSLLGFGVAALLFRRRR